MNELTMEERDAGLWQREGERYIVIIMYSTGTSPPKFIRSGPMQFETAQAKVERILNDVEQGRFACLNSYFVNPKYFVTARVTVFKEKMGYREYSESDFDD